MSKYDPLRRYLRRQRGREVRLGFADIERIIGALLPGAAAGPGWWHGAPVAGRRGRQAEAWHEAGYRAELVGRPLVR